MRGRTRRRLNAASILGAAVLMVGTGGPSLAVDNLAPHVVLGVGLVIAVGGHVWLNRGRAISWPPSGRLRRRPRTRAGWLLKGQDAVREWSFIATAASGALLMAGRPGETLHVVAGVTVVVFAVVHTVLHRRWFAMFLGGGRGRRR